MSNHVGHLAMTMMENFEEAFGGEAEIELGIVVVGYVLPDGRTGVALQSTEGTDWKLDGLLRRACRQLAEAGRPDADS